MSIPSHILNEIKRLRQTSSSEAASSSCGHNTTTNTNSTTGGGGGGGVAALVCKELDISTKSKDYELEPDHHLWSVLEVIQQGRDQDVDDEALAELYMACGVSKRIRIPGYENTIEEVRRLIAKSSNIVVIAGAGISTSCGIPDFRTPGTGLYDQIRNISGIQEPQECFDYEVFLEEPELFYSIYPKLKNFMQLKPSTTHYFLAELEKQGKLRNVYTQNVDDLERQAGVSRVVQCHGTISTGSCMKCGKQVSMDTAMSTIKETDSVPRCSRCKFRKGAIKPNIVFFRESLPDSFFRSVQETKSCVDLMIVMGSSLSIPPIKNLVRSFESTVPAVLINKNRTNSRHEFDIEIFGDCDEITKLLCSTFDEPTAGDKKRFRESSYSLAFERNEETSGKVQKSYKA